MMKPMIDDAASDGRGKTRERTEDRAPSDDFWFV